MARRVTRAYDLEQLKEQHVARFLRILLGYKTCFSYISLAQGYGCYCGAHSRGCRTSMDCLDDCCRYALLFAVIYIYIYIYIITKSNYGIFVLSATTSINQHDPMFYYKPCFTGRGSYLYTVEYFGVRATVNRTQKTNSNGIECKDCSYLKANRNHAKVFAMHE